MNVCPVYERTGGHAYGSVYPGPIGAVLSPQLTGVEDNASLPYASSLCGACFDACPVRIDIPSILVHLRGQHVEERRAASRVPSAEPVAMAAASWVMSDPKRFAAAERASRAGRVLARRGSARPDPFAAAAAVGLDVVAATHRHHRTETFREWWARTRGPRRRVVTGSGADGAARAEVLRRIRTANARAGVREVPAVERAYRASGEHPPGSPDVLDLFEHRLVDYKASVTRTTGGRPARRRRRHAGRPVARCRPRPAAAGPARRVGAGGRTRLR